MQQPFVARGQDILNTFKIDRKCVDIEQFSVVAVDQKCRIHLEVAAYLQSH